MVLVLIDTSYPAGRRILPSFDTHIPLKSVEVRGEIIDFVGHVKITQIFINNYNRNIEAKYLFNLTEDSTVIGMTMQIGDRVLVSHVEEKTEARATYETAISEKKTTCLLEKSSANGIYTVQVGNILQGQEIKIEIEYLAQLECSDEGEMKFVLPTNIAPKYDAGQKSIVDVMDQRNTMSSLTHAAAWSVPFTFKVDLVWRSNNQIKEVKSLTNDIAVSGIDDRTVRVVCETAPRNGDFNILVTTDVLPTLYVSQQGTDSYLMINHRIRDEVLDIEGGEYIILVDRSGSMGDNFSKWSGSAGSGSGSGSGYDSKRKIDYAREATKLFVQSLPSGCSFNVVSFGSSYQTLFPTSVEYNDLTRQQALNQIAGFEANMGGTELFQCLSDVLSGQRNRSQQNNNSQVDLSKRSWKPANAPTSSSGAHSETPKRSSEKIVILMTDGDVGNVDAVVGLIKQYSYNSRVFTIGIGQDVNRFLCEKVAGASNACSEIMVDNPNISMVVAKMLDAATKSYYKHSTILLPQGRRVEVNKAIYPNRFVSMFHKLPTAELMSMIGSSPSTAIRLESVDGISNVRSEWTLPLALEGGVDGGVTMVMSGCIPRLYAADLIKTLEQSNGNHRHTQEIIALSCEYGIMNDRTSFVVVDERDNRSIRTAPMQVTVPQVAATATTVSKARTIIGARTDSASYRSAPGYSANRGPSGGRGGGGWGGGDRFRTITAPRHTSAARPQSSVHAQMDDMIMLCMDRAECLDTLQQQSSTLQENAQRFQRQSSSRNSGIFSSLFGSATSSNAPPAPAARAKSSSSSMFGGVLDVFGGAAPPAPPAAAAAPSVSWRTGSPVRDREQERCQKKEKQSTVKSSPTSVTSPATSSRSREDILDQLINFKISDGSFTYSPQSLQLTSWTRSDILDLISSLQPQMPQMVLSESLMFNLMILKLLKEEGSKKYVMIVRNLEKWLDKQMGGSQISVASILPSIVMPSAARV